MNNSFYVLFLFLSVFISAISQLLLKKSALIKYKSFIREYLNPLVITAYFLFFTAVLIDLLCLKFVPLSFVPVIETSSYAFIIILSRIFFQEKLPLKKIIGISIIIIGILIYII